MTTANYFVDESGDGVLFGAQGRVLLGQPGGQNHFMMGALQVAQPEALADQLEVLRHELLRDPGYRYRPDELYDQTVARLFKERIHSYESCRISYGIRGRADRTRAFQRALDTARTRFEQKWNTSVATHVDLVPSNPGKEVCLQAVDYALWALQRHFNQQESRFIELLWDKVGLVHAVDDKANAGYGTYYSKKKPLPALTGAAS
jgi:hypothetical protein